MGLGTLTLHRLLVSEEEKTHRNAAWILSMMGDGESLPLIVRGVSNCRGEVDELVRGMILASVARQTPPQRSAR
jgi:hypothetical protein